MESRIEQALVDSDILYFTDDQPENVAKLDFYLPDFDLYIEVKQFHSPRVAEQCARAQNVIVAQGRDAVSLLASLLRALGR